MTDHVQPILTGWSRHLAEARVLACVFILAAVAWLGGQLLWSRDVAASLAIALLFSGSSTLRDVWIYRQGWRGALVLGLFLLAILWPFAWLLLTYRARHPYG